MYRLLSYVLVGWVACGVAAGSLFAQEAKKAEREKYRAAQEQRFKKLDTNADGALSVEEFKAQSKKPEAAAISEKVFKIKDTNKDAKLSLDEFRATSFEERLARFDKNGDGAISLEEFKAGQENPKRAEQAEATFKEQDRNGDGKLTAEDFPRAKGAKQGGRKKAKPAQ